MSSRSPLSGYNHNIRYKNRVYHVQTEDSGLENPHIFTHLFLDGQIISTERTEYTKLVEDPDNEKKVRKMMQDQHKTLMKRLRKGKLDDKIISLMGDLDPEKDAKGPPAPADVVSQPMEVTEAISVDQIEFVEEKEEKKGDTDEVPVSDIPEIQAFPPPARPAPAPAAKRLQVDIEVTQPIDIRQLHGFDKEEPPPDIVDKPSADALTTYSHVYKDKLPEPSPEKTTQPRSPSKVFGQPLPGNTTLPSDESPPSMEPLTRKSGVYLVPGGPPQRPPHPDPSVRKSSKRSKRIASSPQRYTAPSKTAPVVPKVAPRGKRTTGAYQAVPRDAPPDKPSKEVVARPVVIVGQPVSVGQPNAPTTLTPPPMPKAPEQGRRRSSGIFGSDLISERSLDEVILAYLAEDSEGEE